MPPYPEPSRPSARRRTNCASWAPIRRREGGITGGLARLRRPLHSCHTETPAMPSEVPPAPLGSASLDEHRRRGRAPVQGATKGRVLVLNATFEPINVCTVRRAAVLLLKEKAE